MHWVWDKEKDAINRRKHKLGFETASLVFHDSLAASRRDPYPDEERWQTIGLIGPVIVFVVHTAPEVDPLTGVEIGRIVSARKATPHERRAYEEDTF